ncbi:MAG: DUF3604 domain-containing protein [Candidatus Rokubacteria bacterium]|nr:DUF3604 domain-containing protein [Candidatus Rokubacteria bacterium]
MPINTDPEFIGRASIAPDEAVVAGHTGTWTITYEVGAYGYDERARVKIATRFASDWAPPQTTDAKGRNYTTVRLESKNPTATASLAWEPRGWVRPWLKCFTISIANGSLHPGDKIHVTLGDTSGGSPGSRAQTFREKGCEFLVLVDPFGTEIYTPLPSSPKINVVGGGLHHLVTIAPTTVRAGEPFEALVKVEDVWGNPAERFDGELKLTTLGAPIAGLPPTVRFKRGELAVARIPGLTIAQAGQESRIVANFGFHKEESNIVRALAGTDAKTWWGDLHGQTRATVGTGTIEEYFTFGRDVALLDAMCHQANDFQVTAAEWDSLKRETARFHENGRCVVLLGYEWSGMTPGGGDRNVIFRGEDGPIHRSSHAEVDDMSDAATDCFPVSQLFERLRGRDDVMLIPHVGGRYADIVGYHEPALEKLVEIYSDWGRFEWLLHDALQRGYRVGVVANSDGHKGRPGASHPGASTFGAYGGLTCILADALTREGLFDALRARRCYAVSAAQRIHVQLAVNGLPMGAEARLEAGKPVTIAGRVVGTGPIERVDVYRGLERLRSVTPYEPASFEGSKRYRVAWAGSRVRGRDRLTRWDGHVELSAGKIVGATPYAMENPEKGIVQQTATQVSWVSTTTGDDDGVDLRVDAPIDAVLKFRTPVIDVDVPIAELADGEPKEFPAGGVDLRVSMRRLPAKDTTSDLTIEVTDQAPPAGRCHAYWIRVTQEDGAQAWTSPVYLDA